MSSRPAREREIKACKSCAKAKVKCETEYRHDKCKRCQRLHKECENQTPGAHSQKRLPDGKASRADILRLESKVDSVTSHILSTSTQSQAGGSISASLSPSPFPVPPPPPISGYSPVSVSTPNQTLPLNNHEALSFLNLYCAEMAPLFPFVAIPPDITPHHLRHEKPVLYMSIMMAACQHDNQRQLELARMVRNEISQAVLVRGDKSLGLVEGMLVYIAWNHVHIQLGAQLINLVHLAAGMLTELNLTKQPHSGSKTSAGAFKDNSEAPNVTRSLAERRVLLGLFWIGSTFKICYRDIDALHFTKYADACCRALEEIVEYPSDVYLVHLVRLQQKADKIGEMLYSEDLDTTSGVTPPLAMGITALEKEIVNIGPSLPLDIPQASLLMIGYKTISLYLYKIALDDSLFGPSTSPTYAMLRTSLLTSCLTAIDSLVTLFFSLPPLTLFSLPYLNWGQMGHALLLLSRLSDAKHATWDPTYAIGTLDHRESFRRFARRLEEVMQIGAQQMPPRFLPDVFVGMASKARELGDRSGSAGAGAGGGVNGTGAADGGGGVPGAGGMPTADMGFATTAAAAAEMNLSQDDYLTEFFDFFDMGQGQMM